jgi:hypothetical protein
LENRVNYKLSITHVRGQANYKIFNMNKEIFNKVLCLVVARLNKNNISWCLIGSFNLFLQGIDVGVQDIDILVYFKDYEKIKELFLDLNISGCKKLLNGEGEEIKYSINGIEVEFCFENENGFYIKRLGKEFDRNNLVHLEVNSVKINCYCLQDELAGYEYLGRPEKVKIISNFLQNADSK